MDDRRIALVLSPDDVSLIRRALWALRGQRPEELELRGRVEALDNNLYGYLSGEIVLDWGAPPVKAKERSVP